jgi:hypothetical protein
LHQRVSSCRKRNRASSSRHGWAAALVLVLPNRNGVFDDVASDDIFEKATPVVHLLLKTSVAPSLTGELAMLLAAEHSWAGAVAAESLGKALEEAGSFAAPGTSQPSVRRAEDCRCSRPEW